MTLRPLTLVLASLTLAACGPGEISGDDSDSAADSALASTTAPTTFDGQKRVFLDDFATLDKDMWGVYQGTKSGERAASHTTVSSGVVTMTAYRDASHGNKLVTGGMAQKLSFTYGTVLARVRFDGGVGARAVALLWPSNGEWPPEEDFFELGGTNTAAYTITNHYKGASGPAMQHLPNVPTDVTQWHVVGIHWTASRIDYLLDGKVVDSTTEHVPQIAMHLCLQGGLGSDADSAPANERAKFQTDWVAIYR